MWDRLAARIVLAESVRQALLYAEKGDAEAALVGRAIARAPGIRTVDIDPGRYDPLVQVLGIVAATGRPADAARFAQFVLGEEGQEILRQFGFQPVATAKNDSRRGTSRRE